MSGSPLGRPRLRAVSLALLAAGLAAVLAVRHCPWAAQATLSGRVRELAERLGSADPAARVEALEELGRLGPAGDVLPFLVRALDDPDPHVRRAAVEALQSSSAFADEAVPALARAAWKHPDASVRSMATAALGGIAARAAPAVPTLLSILADRQQERWHRVQVLEALGAIGAAAMPALDTIREAVRDPEPEIRRAAAWSLARVWAPAEHAPAASTLLAMLSDPDREVRWEAAGALFHARAREANRTPAVLGADPVGRIVAMEDLARSAPAPEVIALLADHLDDPDPRVRLCAVRALGEVVPRAAPEAMIAPLIAALRARDAEVRWGAARSLLQNGRLDPRTAAVALARALGDADMEVALLAARGIGELAAEAAPAIPALVLAIRAELHLRDAAFDALFRIGPQAGPALLDLLRQGRRGDAVRQRAADMLGRLLLEQVVPEAGAEAVPSPVLLEALTEPEFVRRALSARAFERWDADVSTRALDALVEVFADESLYAWQRREALDAIGRLGPAAARLAPALVHSLGPEQHDRAETVRVLGGMGPAARPAIPALAAAARSDRERAVRQAAVEALARIAGSEVAPVLRALLPDPDAFVGIDAARFLMRLAPHDAEARQRLTAALENPAHRSAALAALRDLGPAAAFAAAGIERLLAAPGYAERREALDTLAALGDAAGEALEPVVSRLADPEPSVRQAATAAVEKLARDPDQAAIALGRVIEKDAEVSVRWSAMEALVRLAARAPAAVPVLERALGHRDAPIRLAAAKALGEAGPAATSALGTLAAAVDDRDASVRAAAVTALGRLRPITAASTEALVRVLERVEDWDAPRAAADAIQRTGPEDEAGVPALVRCLSSRHPWNREVCARGLAGIGPAARAAVPDLERQALDPEYRSVQAAAIAALERVGIDATPALEAVVARSDPRARIRAAAALARVHERHDRGRAERNTEIVVAALGDPRDVDLRVEAAQALRDIPGGDSTIVPALVAALGDAHPAVVAEAARTLGERRSVAAISPLTAVLALERNPGSCSREACEEAVLAALAALAQLGPAASRSTPEVRKLLAHRRPEVRAQARETLQRILGEKARPSR